MNGLDSISLSAKNNCEYYRRKIAEHTPPETESDERLIRTYQRSLIRDSSLLYNLDMLKLIETMRRDSGADRSGMPYNLSMSSATLDLNEFKALLDEYSD